MLEQMLPNVITNNLPKVIVTRILQYGNFFKTNLASKLLSFDANGVLIFQGVKVDIIRY